MKKSTTKQKPSKLSKPSKKPMLMYFLLAVALVILYIPFSKKVAVARTRAVSQAPLRSGNLLLSKFNWYEQDPTKAMSAPRLGTHYVTMDIAMEHTLPTGAWFAPAVESYVVNEAGVKRSIELVRLDNPFEARSYSAGEQAVGSLSFLVGDKDNGLKWCYHFTADKGQKDLCAPLNKYNHRATL